MDQMVTSWASMTVTSYNLCPMRKVRGLPELMNIKLKSLVIVTRTRTKATRWTMMEKSSLTMASRLRLLFNSSPKSIESVLSKNIRKPGSLSSVQLSKSVGKSWLSNKSHPLRCSLNKCKTRKSLPLPQLLQEKAGVAAERWGPKHLPVPPLKTLHSYQEQISDLQKKLFRYRMVLRTICKQAFRTVTNNSSNLNWCPQRTN